MSQLPKATYSLCEVVADLAMNMQDAIDREVWAPPPDSRERVRLCIEWAVEFEAKHAGRVWDGEYLEEIDEFFRLKTQA